MTGLPDQLVLSIIVLRPDPLPYDPAAWCETVRAALEQDLPAAEVVLADARPAGGDAPPEGVRAVHAAGAGRAALINTAIRACTGEWVLLVLNERSPVRLRRSAGRAFAMAAGRHPDAGLIYADYELIGPDGTRTERHLLDHHPGRLRETTDYGLVWLVRRERLLTAGLVDETFRWADLYDLRLRLSEAGEVVHIGNRTGGSLYEVHAAATKHNVFDYLLAGREAQVEFERACTAHLNRMGAYLRPGAHLRETPRHAEVSGDVLASVVIPVHRRPEFIGTAIESVLAQTVRAVEVIVVVNGGRDDATAEAVAPYLEGGARHRADRPAVRLRVLDVNNIGLCLNAGIAAARGRYYVQLDSDDRLKPNAVEKLLAVFDSDPHVGMVVGSYEVWELDPATGRMRRNEAIPVVTHEEWTEENGRNNLLRINGAGAPRAARIDVIREVGGFGLNDTPHSRNYGEDYDLVLRISERYRIGRVWEPIYEVIRHPGGTDHSIDQATVDRNDNAKDHMRLEAIRRRQRLNAVAGATNVSSWPAPLVLTREQVRRIDKLAMEEYGLHGIVLMENAGRNAAQIIDAEYGPDGRAFVVCGTGNNGGDGFVIARHLHNRGWAVRVLLAGDEARLSADCAANYRVARAMGLSLTVAADAATQAAALATIAADEVIVDALLGTGFAGEVRSPLAELIAGLGRMQRRGLVAVDVPSGLDCETGAPAAATVRADLTITFVAVKRGFLQEVARPYVGQLVTADIGVPHELVEQVAAGPDR